MTEETHTHERAAAAGIDCERCDARLIDFAYAELDDAERVAVARHLAGCSRCALEFCRLKADLDGVLDAVVESPPQAVRRRIRAEVERSFGPRWWHRVAAFWSRPIPAYGVVVASLIPVALWVATAMRPGSHGEAPAVAEVESSTRPPALTDYDSMVPLLPEDRPL
jgi:anti-sigma factor RsiW